MATIAPSAGPGPLPVPPPIPFDTLADVLAACGDVPPERIRFKPYPGTATEDDVVAIHGREKRICELVDGVLVEKPMGLYESRLGVIVAGMLEEHVQQKDLGIVTGADGMMRFRPRLVRIPDVAFIDWKRLPEGKTPRQPIPDLVPDLAVEVLSKTNTRKEMVRKLHDYFQAGVRLVWYLDPEKRSLEAYTAPDRSVVFGEADTIDGGEVLPGFTMRLADVFARTERQKWPE